MSMPLTKQDVLQIDTNLKIGGIAPNVIHELSGVYSNFPRAFKEIISNSYDADSTEVIIEFADDYEWVTIEDNGTGMTPFEFQNDYLRIGTNPERRDNDLTLGGRLRIGRKGIGFLALARYCKKVEIFTHADRKIHLSQTLFFYERNIDDEGYLEIDIFSEGLNTSMIPFFQIDDVILNGTELEKNLYKIDRGIINIPNARNLIETETDSLIQSSAPNNFQKSKITLQVKYSLNCNKVDLFATIDYHYLLNSKDNYNIVNLEDFSKISIISSSTPKKPHFTQIKLYLHDFIKIELGVPKKTGRVRNISSSSGFEKFLWNLSRSTPVEYDVPEEILLNLEMNSLIEDISSLPFNIHVTNRKLNVQTDIKRPFIGEIQKITKDSPIISQSINIRTDSLIAKGYLLGFKTPIFPGEIRGISIRVRGVEIGSPGYLGIENELPLKYRSVLDHIVGEINVSNGLDAIHTIMAGREGFYIEDKQYQFLKKQLVGNGGMDFGLLGKVIKKVIEYQSIESSALRIVQEAKLRRDAYLFISYALNNLIVGSNYGRPLRRLFSRQDILANHLVHLPDYNIQRGDTSSIYKVKLSEALIQDYDLDFINKEILLRKDSDFWKTTVFILGRSFSILLKNGEADDALCEVDFSDNKIYSNWMHPARGKIGDANFIKTALAWKIAYYAANGDVDMMMNLALRILSFSQQ